MCVCYNKKQKESQLKTSTATTLQEQPQKKRNILFVLSPSNRIEKIIILFFFPSIFFMTLRLVIIVVNIYPNTCRSTVAAATTTGRAIWHI